MTIRTALLRAPLAALLAWPAPAPAEDVKVVDPIVVTATKTDLPATRMGSSVTVLSEEEIRRYLYPEIEDALRSVPGVDVQRSGSVGKLSTVRIRGASSNQVQVLVDGLRVKSPTLGQFDFSDLSLDGIGQIDIVRGPQSTLQGADAIGGVINVITKKGAGPVQGELGFEGGTYETFREHGAISGALGRFNFAGAASRTDSEGREQAFDNDDSGQTAFAGRVGVDFPWDGTATATGRYSWSTTDIPNQGFFPFDQDPDSQQQTELSLYTFRYDQRLFPWWRVAARTGEMWNNQSFEDGPLPAGDFAFTSRIETRRREVELLSTWDIGSIDTLTVGVERQHEHGHISGTFNEGVTTNSMFAQNELRLFDRVFLGGGLRWDDNDTFGDELTPRVSLVVLVTETGTRLRGAWSQGFRAPTLNDLFFPDFTGDVCPPFGNPDLRPETSTSWEAGLDQKLAKNRVRFGVTYFHNRFEDLITVVSVPPFCAQAGNVGRARAEGVEAYAELEPLDWILFTVNYTFTDTEDEETGRELPRIPRHRWNAGVTVTPIPRLSLFAQSTIVSRQFDPIGGPGGVHNPGYYRVDVGGTLTLLRRTGILDRLDLTTRVQNLTNVNYSEVAGFRALGLTALAGLTAYFR
jgi:vitamin B12 transporter